MPVIQLAITKIEANKRKLDKPLKGKQQLQVANNSKILEMRKEKLPNIGEALVVDFEFDSTYTPNVGKIVIGGSLIYHVKDLKKIIKEEGKKKVSLNSEAYAEVQNAILAAGTMQAMLMAKELRLPSPLQLPKVSPVDEKKKDSKKSYA